MWQALNEEAESEVKEAVRVARSDPEPPIEAMYYDIYNNPDSCFTVRGTTGRQHPAKWS